MSTWTTDAARYETGLGHCARDRYLRHHAGPQGTGWTPPAPAERLVTERALRYPLATLHREMVITDAVPSDASAYARTNSRQTGEPDPGLAREQATLYEGVIWTWTRAVLPLFHVEHRIMGVEVHDVVDLTPDVAWDVTVPLLTQQRGTGAYHAHLFTLVPEVSRPWAEAWPYLVPQLAQVLGVEARLGITVQETWVHALVTGKRVRAYDPTTKANTGPKYQASPLVYGYQSADGEWSVTKERGYQRTGLWEMPPAIWQQADCRSPLDYWTRYLFNTGDLQAQYHRLGPFHLEPWQRESLVQQVVAEETRWTQRLTMLRATAGAAAFGSVLFQAALDATVPQNRGVACRPLMGDPCPCLPICNREDGWETPTTSFGFEETR
ncbi:MAG TPA: hypothetical protein VN903_36290 [Polyangia bacterium]|nr:hypothetical protein [Polyangia bacterium]